MARRLQTENNIIMRGTSVIWGLFLLNLLTLLCSIPIVTIGPAHTAPGLLPQYIMIPAGVAGLVALYFFQWIFPVQARFEGGTVTLVGISTSETIEYNFAQIMDKELTIKSVFRYRNIYPRAIAAVASGAIDVKGIVTHTFDLDHIQEAYQEAVNNKTDLVKAVIRIQ